MPNAPKQELVEFTVDEVSLVDNPAIEREFALIKNADGKTDDTAPVAKADDAPKGSVSGALAAESKAAAAKIARDLADAIEKVSPQAFNGKGDDNPLHGKDGLMSACYRLQDLLYHTAKLMVVPAALAKAKDGQPVDLKTYMEKAAEGLAAGLAALPRGEDTDMAKEQAGGGEATDDKDKPAGKAEGDCPACKGSGKAFGKECGTCGGTGKAEAEGGKDDAGDDGKDEGAEGGKPNPFAGKGTKRLTAARLGKLSDAFKSMADALQDCGVEDLSALLGGDGDAPAPAAAKPAPVAKSADGGSDDSAALRETVAKLEKRLGQIEGAGASRALSEDGGTPVAKSEGSLFKGLV